MMVHHQKSKAVFIFVWIYLLGVVVATTAATHLGEEESADGQQQQKRENVHDSDDIPFHNASHPSKSPLARSYGVPDNNIANSLKNDRSDTIHSSTPVLDPQFHSGKFPHAHATSWLNGDDDEQNDNEDGKYRSRISSDTHHHLDNSQYYHKRFASPSPEDHPPSSHPPPHMSSKLSLQALNGQSAQVRLGAGSSVYSIGVSPSGKFEILLDEKNLLDVDRLGHIMIHSSRFSAQGMSVSSWEVRGVPQWALLAHEIFTPSQPTGWSLNHHMSCGGVTILTKYPTVKSEDDEEEEFSLQHREDDLTFSRTFAIPRHHEMIRLVATVHFVDDWQGETAYLKVDGSIVWTQSHTERNSNQLMNICGKVRYPDSKFSVPIDVTIPHSSPSMKVTFGSNLRTDQALFGLSSLAVYMKPDITS